MLQGVLAFDDDPTLNYPSLNRRTHAALDESMNVPYQTECKTPPYARGSVSRTKQWMRYDVSMIPKRLLVPGAEGSVHNVLGLSLFSHWDAKCESESNLESGDCPVVTVQTVLGLIPYQNGGRALRLEEGVSNVAYRSDIL